MDYYYYIQLNSLINKITDTAWRELHPSINKLDGGDDERIFVANKTNCSADVQWSNSLFCLSS